MDLYPFQSEVATYVAEKFGEYQTDPLLVTRDAIVPFFQNISAITGAGKTIILADIITQMRLRLSAEPVVLWISKGKVVVSQTYANLAVGKYADFIPNFTVLPLLDCKPIHIEDVSKALLLVATVGKFNQRDMDKGDRMVYQERFDSADSSLWNLIQAREFPNGVKRPLLIIYDEGHNLSDQQTELLLKLNPDAIISASATLRVPEILNERVIRRLTNEKEWTEKDFTTAVKSSDVVKSGLIKKHIEFGGYVTPMEFAIDELMADYKKMCDFIRKNDINITPKAIYVSNTNIVAETGEIDDPLQAFELRKSRPINIWKYLTGTHDVNGDDIAVYCDLKVDNRFPLPANFHLFSGGDNDYSDFIAGDYHHIIFNLSLQEGWDDPECYFAYIDKDMGSKDQVTQVLGRVLRQPGAKHFQSTDLNTAHVYVHSDSKNVIDEAVEEIRKKIITEIPEIILSVYRGKSHDKNSNKVQPKKEARLPRTTTESANALKPISTIVNEIINFSNDTENTVGTGSHIKIIQNIGTDGNKKPEWMETKHTNRITARWLFKREIQRFFPDAVNLCDTELPKFDALIEYNSIAAGNIIGKAHEVVKAYIEHSIVIQDAAHTDIVPEIYIDPKKATEFNYSLHPKYSDFNVLELDFAKELDKTKKLWFRNPPRGLFDIPLLDEGGTNNFNPDFLVWTRGKIFAIDTKGDHLIVSDAGRKLFSLDKRGKGPDLIIKLVTKGGWNEGRSKINDEGYTVWYVKNGMVARNYCRTLKLCVEDCLTYYG
jgi:type III restriction enzyme